MFNDHYLVGFWTTRIRRRSHRDYNNHIYRENGYRRVWVVGRWGVGGVWGVGGGDYDTIGQVM